ncbi:MAG: ATP-binding protein [Pseudomonadota bacterium]
MFWLAALFAPVLLIVPLDRAFESRGQPPVARIAAAEYFTSTVTLPIDLPATGWQPVELGYSGPAPAGNAAASGWFRLRFDAGAAPAGLWSVYLPKPFANVAMFVNGEFVGDGGPMVEPIPRHRRPLNFTFPARLLHQGENLLEVHVVTKTWGPRIGQIYVAPAQQIEPAYKFTRAMLVTVKQVLSMAMFVVALIMAVMFALRRREGAFGWFSLMLIFWGIHIQMLEMPRAWFDPPPRWESVQGSAIGLYAICAAMFILRYLGISRPKFEKLLLAWTVFGVGTLALLMGVLGQPEPWFYGFVWMPVSVAIGFYQLGLLLWANYRNPDTEVKVVALVSWLGSVVALRDALVDVGILRGNLYFTYVAAPVLLVFAAILLRRFVNALEESERAKDALELRVTEKSRELELNLGRVKDLEREQALSAERERIMQDMHDGIGGQLVQALAIASSRPELAPIEESLRTCLDELRIMIDSIEPVDGDLASVLGTLRVRMSRRLAQAGVEMRWQVGDMPMLPQLGPKHVLEITRIVQEAIANTLKHSGTKRIGVAARTEQGARGAQVVVEVSDEGGGFGAERGEGTGRGIAGMHRRAALLGGSLHIASDPKGTTVRLELPLELPSKQAAPEQAREHGSAPGFGQAHSSLVE